jgi:hypothetical protein
MRIDEHQKITTMILIRHPFEIIRDSVGAIIVLPYFTGRNAKLC